MDSTRRSAAAITLAAAISRSQIRHRMIRSPIRASLPSPTQSPSPKDFARHGSVAVEVLSDGGLAVPAPLSIGLPAGHAGSSGQPTAHAQRCGSTAPSPSWAASSPRSSSTGSSLRPGQQWRQRAFPLRPPRWCAFRRSTPRRVQRARRAPVGRSAADDRLVAEPDATPVHPQAPSIIVEAPAVSVAGRRTILGAIAPIPSRQSI